LNIEHISKPSVYQNHDSPFVSHETISGLKRRKLSESSEHISDNNSTPIKGGKKTKREKNREAAIE
jgi:hypothetical protein